MAVTWELKITPIRLDTKEASVQATRTDDTDVENPVISVYVIPKAVISNQAQKLAVCDEIWAKHQAYLNRQAVIDDFVSGLEALGKTNLEARE